MLTPESSPTSATLAVNYRQVDRNYIRQLRVEISLQLVLIIGLALFYTYFAPVDWRWIGISLAVVVTLIWLLMVLLWAPRRYQLTGYDARELDVHYRTGALWRRQVAVPVSRIQHVEIAQGMIARTLGLSQLVIYTAGGSGSDLAIPGLPLALAERLRDQLLDQVAARAAEETEHMAEPQA